MAYHDQNHVISCDAVVLWDGITRPDEDQNTKQPVHNIRVAISPNAPEYGELHALATKALNESEYKGVLPAGENAWPLKTVDADKFGAHLNGYIAFTAKTRQGAPTVVNKDGQELSAMQYGKSFYPGAIVRVLVHAYAYNNKQKGIGFGLDGVQVINDKAPALDVGTAGLAKSAVVSAFGGSAGAGAPTAKQMAPGCPYTYEALQAAGWSDAAMIQAGHMLAPAPTPAAPAPAPTPAAPAPAPTPAAPAPAPTPAAPAPAPTPAAPAPAPTPAAPVAPAHDLVPGAGKQSKMTATAQYTYDQYVASGWTDAQLIANGFMLA